MANAIPDILVADDVQGLLDSDKSATTGRCGEPAQALCTRTLPAPERPRTCFRDLTPTTGTSTMRPAGSALGTGSRLPVPMLQGSLHEPHLQTPHPGVAHPKVPCNTCARELSTLRRDGHHRTATMTSSTDRSGHP